MLTLRVLLAETSLLSLAYYFHTCSYEYRSVRKVLWVKEVKRREVVTVSNIFQLLHCSNVTFVTISVYIDSFVSFWHEFKNSFAVEIAPMHWQPFTLFNTCTVHSLLFVIQQTKTQLQ